jgi:uncharacterized protein
MIQFEWDDVKAKSNVLKHGVSFEEAVSIFLDARALTFFDTDHSDDEDRSRTFGISSANRLLVVVHTDRGSQIRIIGARKATKHEKSIYESN